jgi:predicted DNA-binding transcriptional regulator AlpA
MKAGSAPDNPQGFPESGPVTAAQVLRFLSISRTTLWVWRRKLGFHRPIKPTPRTARWLAEDVRAWLAGQRGRANRSEMPDQIYPI